MRAPSFLRSLSRGQVTAIVAVVALILGTTIVVLRADDEDASVRVTSDGSTSTTEGTTTTSEAETTTTMAPTTTSAPTTTVPPTTAPPATAPPPTSPPPDPGPLDMSGVLAFAKAGVGGAEAPYTSTGARVCPAMVERPSDAGDDSARDIDDWYLARYCDGVYRAVLATTTDTPALDAAWVQADTKPGGCAGIDVVVIGWHVTASSGGTGGRGAVVATSGCDRASWRWVDAAGFPVFNGAWLQLDFRGAALGDPAAFDWRGAVRAVGESGGAIDMVPNGGPEHFVR